MFVNFSIVLQVLEQELKTLKRRRDSSPSGDRKVHQSLMVSYEHFHVRRRIQCNQCGIDVHFEMVLTEINCCRKTKHSYYNMGSPYY